MDKKKILICDDEEGVREALNLILENDYNIAFATTGEEVVDFLKSNSVDLVVLDIKMPKVNGLEALKTIKELKPDTKVIIATGYQSAEIAEETIKLGACDYITKPFDRGVVLKTIKDNLS